jgi:uncharacterized membrane protein
MDLGDDRTFEQDPKYALRLLVDIAIKALSPAINDPTTAVQALDQIEDLCYVSADAVGNRRFCDPISKSSSHCLSELGGFPARGIR